MPDKQKLSTENYKGVRDFYPEEMFLENYIFDIWRKITESFGYIEYGASLLEPAELYKAKSSEEIVNEQTYTFTDRGGREITLRPEMTPTLARMIAGREHDLSFPLRWYSIPNLFRYERPQKGRLREHWQLNVDLFGLESLEAEVEIIVLASELLKSFGAKNEDFVIKLNNRKLIDDLYDHFSLTDEQKSVVSKIIDKKEKISKEIFSQSLEKEIGLEKSKDFIRVTTSNERIFDTLGKENQNAKTLASLIDRLGSAGVDNVVFEPTMVRGFDYYTGTVFELFDTNIDNPRSILGGGRYDDLLDIFEAKKIPAVGFGAGDVTMQDFLKTHSLLPQYAPKTLLYIAVLENKFIAHAEKLAKKLRKDGINTAIDLSCRKVGDQLKTADKQSIPFILVIGEDEIQSEIYTVKKMETGEEKEVKAGEIINIIKND